MVTSILEAKFRDAFSKVGIAPDIPILLSEATREEFGDYQVNGAMPASKALKINSRELAQVIVDKVDKGNIIASLSLAGPGFINIKLLDSFITSRLGEMSKSNHYGVLQTEYKSQTVVIDYSSPNLAKEMHVGHLRSTVIGDALNNILSYVGDKVIAQNHVGDWGTQFGMLIAYMVEHANGELEYDIKDLEEFYRKAKIKFDEDEKFRSKSRNYVVILQNWQKYGEEGEQVYRYWKQFTTISMRHCQFIYDKLDIRLSASNIAPESMYNSKLDNIIQLLESRKLIKESDGAKCVFFEPDELNDVEGVPFIVQKGDGGYLYSTTDLAAIDYRTHVLAGSRIIYVVDSRQSLHFKQLFNVARKAGLVDDNVVLEHVQFGTMTNEDGKPFKTRMGGTVKLIDLISESYNRAFELLKIKKVNEDSTDLEDLTHKISIAAIKYADLSKNRTSDYVFSFDKMLAFDGNTAPYLLYAYTRIQSLLKKAKSDFGYDIASYVSIRINITITKELERKLLLMLLRFADVIMVTAKSCYPHYLCQYLYNLVVVFMQFYEFCNILKETNKEVLISRLLIIDKVGEILKTGLELLGIQVVAKM